LLHSGVGIDSEDHSNLPSRKNAATHASWIIRHRESVSVYSRCAGKTVLQAGVCEVRGLMNLGWCGAGRAASTGAGGKWGGEPNKPAALQFQLHSAITAWNAAVDFSLLLLRHHLSFLTNPRRSYASRNKPKWWNWVKGPFMGRRAASVCHAVHGYVETRHGITTPLKAYVRTEKNKARIESVFHCHDKPMCSSLPRRSGSPTHHGYKSHQ
jgi:hypothetical protein